MTVKFKKRLLISASAIGIISVVAFADISGANQHRVEMKKLDGQVQTIINKTQNLKPFTMAEVKF